MSHSIKLTDEERKLRQRLATQRFRKKGITKKSNISNLSKEDREILEKIQRLSVINQIDVALNSYLDTFEDILNSETNGKGRFLLVNMFSNYLKQK